MYEGFYKLMLVTNKADKEIDEYLRFIKKCAISGVTSVQMREKNYTYEENFVFGKKIQKILKDFNIPFIVNDNINLALELNADGVHLGQKDGNAIIARKILGKNKIIGLSINSIEQLYEVNYFPIDYIGFGAVFSTQNKIDAKILGLESLKKTCIESKHKIVAIGGINETNIQSVIDCGIDGIAAIDAFHKANDIELTVKKLYKFITEK